jgi:phosphomannomutase/phosphoglucomutase
MGRIFALCSAVAVLMIALAGVGVYWLSMAEMQKTRQEATETLSRGVALGITAQVELLATSINKIVRDPAVIAVVANSDPVEMEKTAAQIENYLPDVLKARLFLPGTISPDNSIVPHLGYADIELVQKTFKKNRKPIIQGKTGPNRNMAIARRIVQDGQAIGVLLVSLDYQFLAKSVRNAGIQNDYLELKQGSLVMGSIGNSELMEDGNKGQIKILGTNWIIQYWTPASVSLGDISLFASVIIIPAQTIQLFQ